MTRTNSNIHLAFINWLINICLFFLLVSEMERILGTSHHRILCKVFSFHLIKFSKNTIIRNFFVEIVVFYFLNGLLLVEMYGAVIPEAMYPFNIINTMIFIT